MNRFVSKKTLLIPNPRGASERSRRRPHHATTLVPSRAVEEPRSTTGRGAELLSQTAARPSRAVHDTEPECRPGPARPSPSGPDEHRLGIATAAVSGGQWRTKPG